MKEGGFEKKESGSNSEETTISNFENKGRLASLAGRSVSPEVGEDQSVASGESSEQENKREKFFDSAAAYCRVVHGKLLCKVGNHDYIEVGRESFRGKEEEVVHMECRRKGCSSRGWTEWRKGKRVL